MTVTERARQAINEISQAGEVTTQDVMGVLLLLIEMSKDIERLKQKYSEF